MNAHLRERTGWCKCSLRDADWFIDIGPGAGQDGGEIVLQDTPADLVKRPKTLTGKHLASYVAP